MHFVYNILFLLAGLKWGDWKGWQKYYPTILFFILCDLFASVLTYNYPLWSYQETLFGMEILQNHTIISLIHMLFVYPVTILIYLGNFPQKRLKQVLWIGLWVILYSIVEYINLRYLDLINHTNGWSMFWSVPFNIVMFTTLKVHSVKPIVAWVLAAIWSIIIIIGLDITFDQMK